MTDQSNQNNASSESSGKDSVPAPQAKNPAPQAENAAPQAKKPVHKKTPRKKSSQSNSYTTIAWVAVLLVIAAGAWVWQVSNLAKEQEQQVAAITQQLAESIKNQNQQIEQQAERNVRYEKAITHLKESLETLLLTKRHLRRDWLLAEAEYLIKLANHRLILMHDVATSISALQAADDRLQEVGDPLLIHLRQEILDDIQALKAVPQVDTVGIALTINAMAKQIPALPLRTGGKQTTAEQEAESASVSDSSAAAKTSSWTELPAAMWQDIKGMFTIRHHDQDIQKLLTPEQKFFLTQNILLQLEQARLAVMEGQDEIYKDRLAGISMTITDYFDVNADATKGMMSSLASLATANVGPAMPDISGSLKQLISYRSDVAKPVVKQPAKNKPAKKNTNTNSKKSVKKLPTKKPAAKKSTPAKPQPVKPATKTKLNSDQTSIATEPESANAPTADKTQNEAGKP